MPPSTSVIVPLIVAVVWPVTTAGMNKRQRARIAERSTSPIVATDARLHWHVRQRGRTRERPRARASLQVPRRYSLDMTIRAFALAAAIAVLYALHQDVWFWRTARPSSLASCRLALRTTAPTAPRQRSSCGSSRRSPGRTTSRTRPSERVRALIPAVLVFTYLAVVLYIGIFAFRHRSRPITRPRTTSSRAARSARWSSCCRSSAPT